jgi:S-adenosylmethionine:tRNA ribosyltransferase-isomerase
MKRTDFQYDLPGELIAQHPLAQRSDSRLLTLDRQSGAVADRQFRELPGLLQGGDLLVFNDTRVMPARMFARKETGGRVEILVERMLRDDRCIAQLRSSKSPKPNSRLMLEDQTRLQVVGRQDEFFELQLENDPASGKLTDLLSRLGHMPLPPYIHREDTPADRERYQTVYARKPGAVAAPTAGLHFDTDILQALADRGIKHVNVTLHVGAGTFQPVRTEEIEDHRMHAEFLEVGAEAVEMVNDTRARGGRVIAIGTTAVRSLETAARNGSLAPFSGDSRLFIYPGYRFRVTDGFLTNFHLPESTLLMLVCAFAGRQRTLAAYRHAVQAKYRFFSYGDAMLVT